MNGFHLQNIRTLLQVLGVRPLKKGRVQRITSILLKTSFLRHFFPVQIMDVTFSKKKTLSAI